MSSASQPLPPKNPKASLDSGEPGPPSPWGYQTTTARIRRDLTNLWSDPPVGIKVEPDENDLRQIHTLIIGPKGTPYQGGIFYFMVFCPSSYPFEPPRVKLMTTDAGRVRFNPNLYACGKVCLSILGTWVGPRWSPAQSLASCLISIQSILNERPYHNEPGFEKEMVPGDSNKYNQVIQHETLRVAVCGMLENETKLTMPSTLRDAMMVHFLEHFDFFVGIAKKGVDLDGKEFQDPFSENVGIFQFGEILRRLQALAKCE